MLRNIAIGQYYPGDSPVHRLDPRVKINIALALIIALFLVRGFAGYALLGLMTLSAIWLARIPASLVIRGLRPILFILILTVVLNILFTGGDVVVRLGPLALTSQGLRQGGLMGLRLILLIVNTSLLTLTTSPISLTDGLESLLRPFRRFGVPAHELAMMMTIALRFIPTLMDEADKIMKAQMARGADFETGNLVQRARGLVPLLVPLFISAFRRADELALAMEARCYRGGEGRTRMKQLAVTNLDYLAIAYVFAFVAGAIGLRNLG